MISFDSPYDYINLVIIATFILWPTIYLIVTLTPILWSCRPWGKKARQRAELSKVVEMQRVYDERKALSSQD